MIINIYNYNYILPYRIVKYGYLSFFANTNLAITYFNHLIISRLFRLYMVVNVVLAILNQSLLFSEQ